MSSGFSNANGPLVVLAGSYRPLVVSGLRRRTHPVRQWIIWAPPTCCGRAYVDPGPYQVSGVHRAAVLWFLTYLINSLQIPRTTPTTRTRSNPLPITYIRSSSISSRRSRRAAIPHFISIRCISTSCISHYSSRCIRRRLRRARHTSLTTVAAVPRPLAAASGIWGDACCANRRCPAPWTTIPISVAAVPTWPTTTRPTWPHLLRHISCRRVLSTRRPITATTSSTWTPTVTTTHRLRYTYSRRSSSPNWRHHPLRLRTVTGFRCAVSPLCRQIHASPRPAYTCPLHRTAFIVAHRNARRVNSSDIRPSHGKHRSLSPRATIIVPNYCPAQPICPCRPHSHRQSQGRRLLLRRHRSTMNRRLPAWPVMRWTIVSRLPNLAWCVRPRCPIRISMSSCCRRRHQSVKLRRSSGAHRSSPGNRHCRIRRLSAVATHWQCTRRRLENSCLSRRALSRISSFPACRTHDSFCRSRMYPRWVQQTWEAAAAWAAEPANNILVVRAWTSITRGIRTPRWSRCAAIATRSTQTAQRHTWRVAACCQRYPRRVVRPAAPPADWFDRIVSRSRIMARAPLAKQNSSSISSPMSAKSWRIAQSMLTTLATALQAS